MDILEIIKQDEKKKQGKYVGRKLYSYKPSLKNDVEYYISNGIEKKVENKNKEIYINFFKMLVTQKIDYILSKPPTLDDSIKDITGLNVYTMLDKLLLNSSLDGQSWLHLYLLDNKLNFIVIKDSEIIPFYTADRKKLEKLIRYYRDKNKLYVEIWTLNGVEKISFDKDGVMLNHDDESHYTVYMMVGNEIEDTINSNFPIIPFLKLENNKDVVSDAYDVECLLTAYNSIATGFIDNVEKFQEALLILRGYIGESNEMKEVMRQIKESKGVSVDKDGDAGYMSIDIPVEARQVLLDLCREGIFLVGRGVDPSKLAEGTNITNIVIKSRYIQLDLKASDCIKRIIEFYDIFIKFVSSVYTNIKFDDTLEFNLTQLMNESERISDCIKSLGVVSKKTIRKHHPWVEDEEEEAKQIEIEEKEEIKKFNGNPDNKGNPFK